MLDILTLVLVLSPKGWLARRLWLPTSHVPSISVHLWHMFDGDSAACHASGIRYGKQPATSTYMLPRVCSKPFVVHHIPHYVVFQQNSVSLNSSAASPKANMEPAFFATDFRLLSLAKGKGKKKVPMPPHKPVWLCWPNRYGDAATFLAPASGACHWPATRYSLISLCSGSPLCRHRALCPTKCL